MDLRLDDSFRKRIVDTFGPDGKAWLSDLPILIEDYTRRWGLSFEAAFSELSYNYVAAVRHSDGTPLVLKLGVPRDELSTEIAALRLYAGVGTVQLLKADASGGALLIEQAIPGRRLAELVARDDEQATLIAAAAMRAVWRELPEKHSFPSVADWFAGLARMRAYYDGGSGPIPRVMLERAEAYAGDLLASMETEVLLHGDLHHFNILEAQREPWLVIDPKGVTGEPCYELGALLRNPWPRLLSLENPQRLLSQRLDLLAEYFGYDRERIRAWGVAQAVLSAWWTLEEQGEDWEYSIAVAELLAEA